MLRFLIWISRNLLALTFIFSGFVKGIDPLGSAYKFTDYFIAFNIGFLEPFALPISFILCAAELLIGLLLLFRIKDILAIWGVFLFMAVFTPLTFILAIYNPVSDCGCFGDAIILSNWETFFKNLPLLLASILLLSYRKKFAKEASVFDWGLAAILVIIAFIPSIHGYRNLPLIDFRPYSIGTNIAESMAVPHDAPMDEYKTTLFYQKDGVVKEFNEENFPWQDTTWKFVDSKSVLVKKGFTPTITEFYLTDFDGWDHTENIIYHPGYYLLAVSYLLDKADIKAFEELNELYYKAMEQGIGFACLTASPPDEIDRFVSSTGVAFPFLMADEIMLKTTIRANPGLILLDRGTIVAKWHHRNFPNPNFFEGNLSAKALKLQRIKNKNAWAMAMSLTVLSLAFLINYLKTFFKDFRINRLNKD
jgi:hypothetical protein